MKYLLILSTVFFISCGKENALTKNAQINPFPAKSDFLFLNTEDNFYFRQELLNAFVEKSLNSNVNLDQFIEEDLEIKNQKDYENLRLNFNLKEKGLAKLVVSFSDRTQVYFLPPKSNLETVVSDLKLIPEEGKKWVWLNKSDSFTTEDTALYLMSVSLEDLMKNDILFYREVVSLDLQSRKMSLKKGTELEGKIKIESKIEDVSLVQIDGKIHYVGRFDPEDYQMFNCQIGILRPNGKLVSERLVKTQEIGLVIKYNGTTVNLNNDKNAEVNEFSFSMTNEVESALNPVIEFVVNENVFRVQKLEAAQYKGDCQKKQAYELRQKIYNNYSVELVQKGRGENLKFIKI